MRTARVAKSKRPSWLRVRSACVWGSANQRAVGRAGPEGAIELAASDHLPAVGIEGIVDDPLGGVLLVVVLEAEMAESLGDRFQAGALGLVPEGIVCVSAVDDL